MFLCFIQDRFMYISTIIVNFVNAGCCKDYGKGPCSHPKICEEIYNDEGKYSSSFLEDTNSKVTGCNGSSNERGHKGHGYYEQTGT